MRIATYNLWNADVDKARRLAAAVDELAALAADVVALQEVPCEMAPGEPFDDVLAEQSGYRQVVHLPYPADADDDDADDLPEGLCLLSRDPLRVVWTRWADGGAADNSFAATARVAIDGATLSLTNLHLDWRDPDGRLRAIADIVERGVDPYPADLAILCGDFNDYEDGPVAGFLERRGWRDAVAATAGAAAPMTLDFAHNPRWASQPSTERPGRFDRIYVRDMRRGAPARLLVSGLFGREPANRFGIVPSDHYGVFVDLAL